MILVTGATGKVGRNVVGELLRAGARVRAVSRSPERAGLPAEVEVVRGDLAAPPPLDGVEKVFLFPGETDLRPFADAARAAGVRHVALLSSSVPGYDRPNPISDAHLAHEHAVAEAGLPYTFVRPGGFMANDLTWADTIRAENVVRSPYGDAGTALIDERDIAAVIVAALLDDAHIGQAYTLTGPQSLTVKQRVDILGQALGRELRFEYQSPEAFAIDMAGFAKPEFVGAMLDFGAFFDGKAGPVFPTVAQVTGRPAHTYAQWAAHHAAEFRA